MPGAQEHSSLWKLEDLKTSSSLEPQSGPAARHCLDFQPLRGQACSVSEDMYLVERREGCSCSSLGEEIPALKEEMHAQGFSSVCFIPQHRPAPSL